MDESEKLQGDSILLALTLELLCLPNSPWAAANMAKSACNHAWQDHLQVNKSGSWPDGSPWVLLNNLGHLQKINKKFAI